MLFALLTTILSGTFAQVKLDQLQVEYQSTPLGIDVEQPQFNWRMVAEDAGRGYAQTAYQIVVQDETGKNVWDSGKTDSDLSLGIEYKGTALQPTSRYQWQLTVWDQDAQTLTADSWFETGLLNPNPDLRAWDGATWIGGSAEDQVLYAHALGVYKLEYELALDPVSKSTRASFLVGGNDSRLMDKNLNIQGVEVGKDESYVAFELDISGLEKAGGKARFNVYRAGYAPDDEADKPLMSFEIPDELVNQFNKYNRHRFYVDCIFGIFQVYLNGREEKNMISRNDNTGNSFAVRGMNLNPVGRGHDYINFPILDDIGFWLPAGQSARFSDITIKHARFPSNPIYEDRANSPDGLFADEEGITVSEGDYVLSGGSDGTLILKDPSRNAAPMLRTEFTTQNKAVKKARLYVTARGIYEMYLNGERVGDDYFNPGLTQYNKHHMYQTYDVTDRITSGREQALGAWLSEGWWSGNITYLGDNWNFFGDRQSLLCKLMITYADGSTQIITSNPQDWKYFNDGPVRYGSFFQGEFYDAAKEAGIRGWSLASYKDDNWTEAVEVPLEGNAYMGTFTAGNGRTIDFNYDDQQLIGQMGKNATIVKTLTAKSVDEVRPGVFVYDMGQNMVGFPRIQLPAGPKGQLITIRYAEMKYPDLPEYGENVGMVMMENIRSAFTHDYYLRNGGEEVIQPRFTFHGYRYLEITGMDQALPLNAVEGKVISSVDEITSEYETSNELVNKLWENITWSMRGNFLSIPTDTPARNERMGWSGDINVFSKAATYLGSVNQFMRRHMMAMRDIQREDGRFTDVAPVGGGFGGTLWGSAGIIVAWETYLQYGDKSLLREHYEAMKRYVNFLESKIVEDLGVVNEGPLGDWLSPEGEKNDNTLLWTAYYAYDLEILSKVADILGKSTEANEFRRRYQETKDSFNATFVDPQTHKTVRSGLRTASVGPPGQNPREGSTDKGRPVDTQASYAIPLAFNIFNETNKPYAVRHLVETIRRKNTDDGGVERPEYSLMTGFIGTASLNQALSENGEDETAYRLLQQETYPSWLYPVINGATTIWERLNSYTIEDGFGGNNQMNSFNHYSFGAVAAWMYNHSLGIQRDEEHPGCKHFILQPTPDPSGQMSWAKGYVDVMYGTISSEWRIEDGQITYNLTVPANTSAILYLPAASLKKIKESGKKAKKAEGVSYLRAQDDRQVFELVSGSYEFVVKD
jgi:alpha-L-rhamnosidase